MNLYREKIIFKKIYEPQESKSCQKVLQIVKRNKLLFISLPVIILAAIFALFLYPTHLTSNLLNPVVESQRTEMKKVPPAIQIKGSYAIIQEKYREIT